MIDDMKRRARKGKRAGRRAEEEEYRGSFCAKCGKKAGRCGHGRLIHYLGEHGEFVVAV
jgi:hypothetical protein